LICFEHRRLSRIKVHMKLNHGHRIGGMWLLLACCLAGSAKAGLASLFTNLNGPRPAGIPRRASILFIQCDSLGYLDLSCYGQKQFLTPHLDRLAAQGMLFTNYDDGGAEGPESRTALLLGHDVGSTAASSPDSPTIAQILQAGGYRTGYIGEWNLGGQGSGRAPWDKGFYEFAGYFNPQDAENYYADFMWRCAPQTILNTNNNHWDTYIGREPLVRNAGGNHSIYIPDLYTKAAVTFIKAYHSDAANHYRPFFLWLNYVIPRPNQSEALRTGNGVQVPTDAPYSEQNWPQAEKNKAAMIARLDDDIGQILNVLVSQKITNSVAVFFSSAAVPHAGGGLDPTFFPSVVSTNDVRLPMIASWPRHIPAGQTSGVHWSPADFLATAAQIAMSPYPTNQVGTSILPVLYGEVPTNTPTPK
jgi:arylsulfatase A